MTATRRYHSVGTLNPGMAGCGEIAAFLAELVVEADTLFGAPDEQNAIAITNALSAAAPEVAVTAADAHMREYALWVPNDVVASDRPEHRTGHLAS